MERNIVEQLSYEAMDYKAPQHVLNYLSERLHRYVMTGELLPATPPAEWRCPHMTGSMFWKRRCCLKSGHTAAHDMKRRGE